MKGLDFDEDYLVLLKARFGMEDRPMDGAPYVDGSRHLELAAVLKEERGYSLYVTVVATHFEAKPSKKEDDPGTPEYFEVATLLRRPGKDSKVAAWRVRLPAGASIPSLANLFPGADWQEREQYDLVGVVFSGHPDLRRLMMPEDWEGHPLRKDYAIDTSCPPWR